jgi:phage gp36-like protein
LVELACQIAYCDLAANPTEYAIKRKSDALSHLRDISRGLLKLDEGTPDSIPSREGQIIVPDAERVFSHDKLRGF